MKLLILGSVAFDTIKTPLGKASGVLGGSAVYSALAASFFTSDVGLVGVCGKDFSEKEPKILTSRGVNLDGLETKNGRTFSWEGEYDWSFTDPKTLATHLNVMAGFSPRLPLSYRESAFVFLANMDPDVQMKVLSQLRKKPRMVFADTMNYWITQKNAALRRVLKKVDVLFLNASEAKQLSGEVNLVRAARAIRKMGPKRLIIKKGEHGALMFSDHSVFSVPGYLMEVLYDPTGAGDSFAGGAIGFLASEFLKHDRVLSKDALEKAFRKAIVYGSVLATFAVEEFGVKRLLILKKSEIEKRYKDFMKMTNFS